MKAVILAGGGGTRLWPLSTLERPKQFQKLVSGRTMLEETFDRLDFLKPEDIYIAINESHLGLTRDLCPSVPAENILLEPALRDTSSCIGLAAALIEKRHPGEIMAIIYADHLIKNKAEFQEKLQIAAEIAEKEGTLNIVEVTAKEPNTNYGYVKLGAELAPEVYELDSFVEKPDLERAKEFVADGKHLWNTGIYVWKAQILLSYYEKLQPETYKKFQEMITDEGSIPAIYPSLEKISIDYAIMEKVDPKAVRIIKADNLGWSDIGNWEAIWEELATSPEANIERGNTEIIDSKGSLIYGDTGRKVALIGLDDIIVVDTPEGLLVCKKDQSKKVKDLKN